MSDSRITKKKKKRRKLRYKRIFLLLFLIIILGGAGYAGAQYYQGLHSAKTSEALNTDNIKFNGTKDANGRINILLLGIDTRGEKQSRTDTMMIAQIDPKTHKVKLVSLMRDMYVEIPGYDNYKLNTAYFLGGPELLRQTIKHNFDIDIQYYALVDFKSFVKVVDTLAPEGIKINVEHEMSKNIGMTLHPGLQTMHGKQLLAYARFRKDAEGDFGRVRRQQTVLKALEKEAISVNGFAKAPKLLGTIQPYIATNMSKMDILGLVKDVLMGGTPDVKTLTVPVAGSYSNATYPGKGAVLDVDTEKNTEAIKSFLNEN
ncbi:LCP family protein [Heyndrickxia ginsengihumi]|uniref:Regulatory protein MsrR n=1 Tax=Heyndrickxia ginsengihumi TaxID=363870 RepID=A0A6M0P5H1_9BACI|nr:LCP family protein [Heyndrickxia ginsengihumi]MCM3023136.1 LCP family protein [Heyndrickxia ginsengihumi]NEY19974.1 LCP family protein [Heyndrickxia ginsengihumi]